MKGNYHRKYRKPKRYRPPRDKQPKYINSPETDIYVKSKNLYGFNVSKKAITDKDFCIIVEGYLDLIIPYQAGIKNLVASCGTAFTHEHARILKRYTSNVVIVFDPDEAGQDAALRSLDLLIEEELNVTDISDIKKLPSATLHDRHLNKPTLEKYGVKVSYNGATNEIDSHYYPITKNGKVTG